MDRQENAADRGLVGHDLKDRTLADTPDLDYSMAAEILFLIETLEKARLAPAFCAPLRNDLERVASPEGGRQ